MTAVNYSLFNVKLLLIILLLPQMVFAAKTPLVFLNWADYMSPEILNEFKQVSGIEIKEVYYDSDEGRDQVLALKDGRGFDLILTSGLALKTYVKQAWLAPLPDELPNTLRHIDDKWRQSYPDSERFAVPYFWGTLGIAYRQDLVKNPMYSWQDFFDFAKVNKSSINLISSSREVLSAALKVKGYSLNTTNKSEINEAFKLLKSISPNIASFNYIDLDETSLLVSGDIQAAMMYSGDALALQEHHQDIVYVLPSEGSNIWVDFITISSFSNQKQEALAFIAFLNRPDIAARLAEYVYYASPNKAARALLDEEFLNNKVIFPDAQSLQRSEFFSELPPRTLRNINQQFRKLAE